MLTTDEEPTPHHNSTPLKDLHAPSLRNPCRNGHGIMDGHLGGTSDQGDPDSWFAEMWLYLINQFALKSALDVGCGVGFSQKFFHDCGLDTLGVEGSQLVIDRHLLKDRVVRHDLTTGPLITGRRFDLVWSCECGEHIPKESVQNFVDTIVKNSGHVVAVCMAPEGAGGYHHVNCQSSEYWIEKFTGAGLRYEKELTDYCKSLCDDTNGRGPCNYFKRAGLIFTNPVVNHLKKAE